mmetsp:Transcript_10534/g.33374  ORF Transcript_10534/g.33374 Transcript_10534/m.33374 type:complete len:210 (-) Transcript_10534:444-1073(-)
MRRHRAAPVLQAEISRRVHNDRQRAEGREACDHLSLHSRRLQRERREVAEEHGLRVAVGARLAEAVHEGLQAAALWVVGLVDVQVHLHAMRVRVREERVQVRLRLGKRRAVDVATVGAEEHALVAHRLLQMRLSEGGLTPQRQVEVGHALQADALGGPLGAQLGEGRVDGGAQLRVRAVGAVEVRAHRARPIVVGGRDGKVHAAVHVLL